MGAALGVEPVGDSPLPSAFPLPPTTVPTHMCALSLSQKTNKQTSQDSPRQCGMVTITVERAKMQAEENVFPLVGNGEPFMGSKDAGCPLGGDV